ncbi:DUF2189 domain-containing protein [Indioceanicola profundi]|uniref:DUF2189 domain-containing protein n=1 Tax=Indioceanicola profundi TaxID=2220096 RepID=UPI000E6AD4F3|nr:DUF2189 domain-containing protein [Indioceanicola profundi]
MTDIHAQADLTAPLPRVRRIAPDRPWAWLQAGMRDLTAAWRVSLAYGAAVVAFSWALVLAMSGAGLLFLLLPLCAGFMIVGPLAAVGLYETSRRLERGQEPSLTAAVTALRANALQLSLFSAGLLMLWLLWIRVAILLYALFFGQMNPNLDNLARVLFTSDASLPFLLTGTLAGGVLAFATFAISAVAIPMLLDRPTNAATAVATSIMAVRTNLKPMVLWAFIIAFCTGLGLATLFFGLAVALPLIGHASWHAYKELVGD